MTHIAASAPLELPFRWWDGAVAVVLFVGSGFTALVIGSGRGRFWYQLVAVVLVGYGVAILQFPR